jgi:hypothetical protein
VDSVHLRVDPELVDERLAQDLGVVALTERVGDAPGRDAERQDPPVVTDDLRVL